MEGLEKDKAAAAKAAETAEAAIIKWRNYYDGKRVIFPRFP